MTKDLLWEIGVEEIPARFLPPAIKQMRGLAEQALAAAGLDYAALDVYATPRRLTLMVEGLPEQARDSESEAKGPAVKAAFDENGAPSRALLGFCKAQGIKPEQALQKEINGNLYIYARKYTAGRNTAQLLPEILPPIADKLFFPKPMRWGYNSRRFARPVRWMTALFGAEILDIEFAGIGAARSSRGHRLLGSDDIPIPEPKDYLQLLRENYVICDQEERRALIWRQILDEAERLGGEVRPDEELLTEVTFLLEYPTALSGRFEEQYLTLPEELVITPMREHQRYFPVYAADGKLLPRFITVRNGDARHIDIVAAGNEKVLRARLKDAEFFYREDLRDNMEAKVEQLSQVVFHEKLGSLRQKVDRLMRLTLFLAGKLGYAPEEIALSARAALLAKADLGSRVVYEFPELQGVIGEYYALAAGEDAQVARAIAEHYLPRFAGDRLPESRAGIAVALADKIDSVCAFFAIGQAPSGSQDPYALRRAASGVVNIILHHQLELSLRDAAAYAFELLEHDVPGFSAREFKNSVEAFIAFHSQRMETILGEAGFSYDTVNAIKKIGSGEANMLHMLRRAQALGLYRHDRHFPRLLAGFNRVFNILRSAPDKLPENGAAPDIDPLLFSDASESELYRAVLDAERQIAPLAENADYRGMLEIAGRLTPHIDRFFERVMVMDKDQALRYNRLALLRRITGLTANAADLSQVVESNETEGE